MAPLYLMSSAVARVTTGAQPSNGNLEETFRMVMSNTLLRTNNHRLA